jgi:CCR4-NOT transcriptional complex subunit CAF120
MGWCCAGRSRWRRGSGDFYQFSRCVPQDGKPCSTSPTVRHELIIYLQIETLPVRGGSESSLKNVLSVSSAGKNRYLLHFNSFNSLTQWTAAIRLSIFEHTSLYEAYTGSLIAAKGRGLNGINSILLPTKFKYQDWARVRFGAGTPWRRCWFVINPPDEKELQKARKVIKKSAYDRLSIPVTGNIKFYETKKTKKAIPIATVTQVFSAYAIYPQSKALIDASTLVKLEGRITTHQPESSSEGLVFVMPEPHAAVSGFEMMLRFLFPTFDTFNLYGRPTRLVADTNHIKSIMFAFPKERRYGYLDVLDVASLLQTPGSQEWSEAQWRKQLKEATQRRISSGRARTNSVNSVRPRYRSVSGRNSDVPMDSARHQFAGLEGKSEFNNSTEAIIHEVPKHGGPPVVYHNRGFSDTTGFTAGSKLGHGSLVESSPDSSSHDLAYRGPSMVAPIAESLSSESEANLEHYLGSPVEEQLPPHTPPAPVANPPAFSHGPKEMPSNRPEASSAQRLANNRMSHATLSQLASVGTMGLSAAAAGAAWKSHQDQSKDNQQAQDKSINNDYNPGPVTSPNSLGHSSSDEGINLALPVRPPPVPEHRLNTPNSTGSPSSQQVSSQRSSPQRAHIDSEKSVRRKPLPQQNIFGTEPQSLEEPSYDDLRHTLDEDVLNRIAPHLPSMSSSVYRNGNEDESVYDDASTASPDYASTHESVYSKKSVTSTKPRMGVMKTVGVPTTKDYVIGDARYAMDKPPTSNPDIPTVDFGPTMAYMPTTGRPNTSDTLKRPVHQRNNSSGTKFAVPTQPIDQSNVRPSSREEYRRSMMWQPGMASGRPITPGGGLTPEQFVQQRAAASPPVPAHGRTPSNAMSVQRPASGDWTQYARSNSPMNTQRDPNYRPSSRGAQSMLNYNDASTHLSAREQEHVARMTGSSFFNMSNDNRKQQAPVSPMGLVSHIDAREREKREMREGMSNQAVQHAIAQRQQHMMQQQQYTHQQFSPQQMQQAGSIYPSQHSQQEPMYNIPGASQTWDALNQTNRPDAPRRSSWYGQLAAQAPQPPPSYHPSQGYPQEPNYYSYAR